VNAYYHVIVGTLIYTLVNAHYLVIVGTVIYTLVNDYEILVRQSSYLSNMHEVN